MEKFAEKARGDDVVRPWSSLLIRDYLLLWGSSLCGTTAWQVRHVANLYQVYAISGSSLKLGLTGFFQALPFIIFGLFGGVLADVFDRKKLIVVAQLLNLIPGVALGVLTITGTIQVWHIYLLSLTTSFVLVFSGPARMALIPRLVPRSHMMNAVTLAITTHQVGLLLGPVLAGILIDGVGLDLTYFFDAALFVPGVVAVLAIRSSGKPEGRRPQISLWSMVEGVRFIWVQRIILSLFLLDFGVTLVGFYQPLLPIFASDVFKVGAAGLGILYAAPAVGSVFGSLTLLTAGDIKRKGALAAMAALFFAGCLALLGIATTFWAGILVVGALGFTDAISVSIRRTVVQLLAPDEMRGRAMSLISIFAQSTNALGALLAGTAAAFLGAPHAVLLGSSLCVLIVLGICRALPELWHYRSSQAPFTKEGI